MEVNSNTEKSKLTQKEEKQTKEKKGSKRTLDPDTLKLLGQIKEKVDKKPFGRKILESEIIALGIRLIKPEQIKELQESTLSEQDRLSMVYEEYQKKHGKLTMDQFIGKLLRGELSTTKV